ncbi:MAG: transcriptional repressor [Chloroflexi bacterium]|nr:transcriptional repressor [Chloroflexota bacterium]
MRNSKAREIILEELKGLTTHPRGDELYDIVRQKLPRISLSTVYRNLNVMRQNGLALELHCGDYNRYDANIMPHNHFLCRRCERVWDVEAGSLPEPASAGALSGFRLEGQYTVFHGLCADCAASTG